MFCQWITKGNIKHHKIATKLHTISIICIHSWHLLTVWDSCVPYAYHMHIISIISISYVPNAWWYVCNGKIERYLAHHIFEQILDQRLCCNYSHSLICNSTCRFSFVRLNILEFLVMHWSFFQTLMSFDTHSWVLYWLVLRYYKYVSDW